MSDNQANQGQGQNNNPDNQGQGQVPNTIDPEVLLLGLSTALDKLQTQGKLDANAMESLAKSIADLERLVLMIQQNQTDFRIQGQTLADGTIECILAGTPVRIDPTSDIAIGAKQIERQRAAQG